MTYLSQRVEQIVRLIQLFALLVDGWGVRCIAFGQRKDGIFVVSQLALERCLRMERWCFTATLQASSQRYDKHQPQHPAHHGSRFTSK